MMEKRRYVSLFFVVILSLAVIGFAGCASTGDDPKETEETPPSESEETNVQTNVQTNGNQNENETEVVVQEDSQSVVVDISNSSFQPNELTVEPGTEVTFVNLDSVAHTATETNGVFDSGSLSQDESFTVTLSEPGEYGSNGVSPPIKWKV